MPSKMLRFKLAAALGAPALVLLLAEVVARVALPELPRNAFSGLSAGEIADAELLWRNRPDFPESELDGPIDGFGLRGPPITLDKPSGVERVLSLGESTTYGHGIHWDRTYSKRLEDRLNADGRRVQVLNAGVRAWSSYQSARWLALEGERFQPDFVLFYHEINDFLPTTFRGVAFQSAGLSDPEAVERGRSIKPWETWLGHSRLYGGLRLGLLRWRNVDAAAAFRLPYDSITKRDPRSGRPWMDNPNPWVRLPDAARAQAIRDVIDWTRSRSVRLVLIHPAYPVSRPHECLLTRLPRNEGIPLVEVEDLLKRDAASSGRRRKAYFLPDDKFHLNETGHAVLAAGLADVLERLEPVDSSTDRGRPAAVDASKPRPR